MDCLPIGYTLHGKAYNYEIERVLGQGSFGITYLAKIKLAGTLGTLDSNIRVAIKEFFMKEINGREGSSVTCSRRNGIHDRYRTKFAHEAEALGRLNHPHIVRVIESFEANNTVYYAMEYIDGGSLDDYIAARNGLPESAAIELVRQIGAALAYMHDHRMLHLDLKPGNIMRRSDGSGVLIDFGLAKQYDENGAPESSTTIGGGTEGYAPIEQLQYREGREFPVTMDVYALGATLYKMLTGERAPKASDVLNYDLPTDALRERGVRPGLIACIVRAMEPKKDHRYASVSAFLTAIENLEPLSEPVVLRVEPEPDTQPGFPALSRPPKQAPEKRPEEPEAFDDPLEVTLLEPGNPKPAGIPATTGAAGTPDKQPVETSVKPQDVIAHAEAMDPPKSLGFWDSLRTDWRDRPQLVNVLLLLLFVSAIAMSIALWIASTDTYSFHMPIRCQILGGFALFAAYGLYELLRNRRTGCFLLYSVLTLAAFTNACLDNWALDTLVFGLAVGHLISAFLVGLLFIRNRQKRSLQQLFRERKENPLPRRHDLTWYCGQTIRFALAMIATSFLAVHLWLRLMCASGLNSAEIGAACTIGSGLLLFGYLLWLHRRKKQKGKAMRWMIPVVCGFALAWIHLDTYYGYRYHYNYIEYRNKSYGRYGLANRWGFGYIEPGAYDEIYYVYVEKESRQALMALKAGAVNNNNAMCTYAVHIQRPYPSFGWRWTSDTYTTASYGSDKRNARRKGLERKYGHIYHQYDI